MNWNCHNYRQTVHAIQNTHRIKQPRFWCWKWIYMSNQINTPRVPFNWVSENNSPRTFLPKSITVPWKSFQNNQMERLVAMPLWCPYNWKNFHGTMIGLRRKVPGGWIFSPVRLNRHLGVYYMGKVLERIWVGAKQQTEKLYLLVCV